VTVGKRSLREPRSSFPRSREPGASQTFPRRREPGTRKRQTKIPRYRPNGICDSHRGLDGPGCGQDWKPQAASGSVTTPATAGMKQVTRDAARFCVTMPRESSLTRDNMPLGFRPSTAFTGLRTTGTESRSRRPGEIGRKCVATSGPGHSNSLLLLTQRNLQNHFATCGWNCRSP
jgi:hypothetical protein